MSDKMYGIRLSNGGYLSKTGHETALVSRAWAGKKDDGETIIQLLTLDGATCEELPTKQEHTKECAVFCRHNPNGK